MFLKSIFQWLPFNVLFNWNRKDQDRYEPKILRLQTLTSIHFNVPLEESLV